VTATVRPPASIGLVSRSFMAPVLAPERPIYDWLCDLDEWTRSRPRSFTGQPVILDVAAVTLSERAIAYLIAELSERGVTVMAIDGVDSLDSPRLPPVVHTEPDRKSLVLDRAIRSGEAVIFPDGDVTVLGSVGSAAEILAGGSIHVYGTLRGRAAAGFKGNRSARIFCSRNEAELLSIDGRYRTADSMDDLRGQPVQAWLADGELRVAPLE
jgi:septum site-determining protein MinC